MQLVLVAHRCCAALHVADIRALVGDDERTLELSRALRVDAEVAGELHRAAHPFRDVAERAVAEYGGVERRVEIVPGRNDRGEIFPDEFRMFAHGLRERAEDDSLLLECSTEGRLHRDRVKDRIDGHAREGFPLVERYSQLVESLFELGVNLLRTVAVLLRRGIVYNVLKVNLGDVQMPPFRRRHPLPFAEGVETEVQQPPRLLLLRGNKAYDVLVQALGDELLLKIRHEAVFIFLPGDVFDYISLFCIPFVHISSSSYFRAPDTSGIGPRKHIIRKITKISTRIKMSISHFQVSTHSFFDNIL